MPQATEINSQKQAHDGVESKYNTQMKHTIMGRNKMM